MKPFNPAELDKIYLPPHDSHKGQNGKLMVIGGSHLFHAASLWALDIATKIVDMVFYASVSENNKIVEQAKQEFRNGIVVTRDAIEDYINEADCILIGPGMLRSENGISNIKYQISNIKDINKIDDEGLQSYWLTKYLLEKYPKKKWVIDAGALQMMDPEWLLKLNGTVILTPHPGEFERVKLSIGDRGLKNDSKGKSLQEQVQLFARHYHCIVLLKGEEDVVCSPKDCVAISGGNAGMTKGGTGDVLGGLVAALACKNDGYLAAKAGSYVNKKAGEELAKRVGFYFNASDLVDEIPGVMRMLLMG